VDANNFFFVCWCRDLEMQRGRKAVTADNNLILPEIIGRYIKSELALHTIMKAPFVVWVKRSG
jgi:hypothetical protein